MEGRLKKFTFGIGLAATMTTIVGTGQSTTGALDSTSSVRFEVASVKTNRSGAVGGSLRRQPSGRVDAVNMPLRVLMTFAYQLQPFRLVGGPGWIASERFDIVAKLEGDPQPAISGRGSDMLLQAMQTLLVERFRLKVHHETRELDIFALVTARPGGNLDPSLVRSTQDCSPAALEAQRSASPATDRNGAPTVFCGMQLAPGRLRVGGMPLESFANTLSGLVGRVVVNRTGLEGNWDFELAFEAAAGARQRADTPPADPDAASIFTALPEQLGLKLESTKGPVDVLVIDSVEHPTEN